MSDSQRIRGLSGIKPSRMPVSAPAGIPVNEAEKRLGIEERPTAVFHDSTHASTPASITDDLQASLPNSLRNRKSKEITVSRTFRLPLPLVEELETVAKIHELPMVTILAEALELHLARFPRQSPGA